MRLYLRENGVETEIPYSDSTAFHVTSFPTASADRAGEVYQYVGETTNDYTKGQQYICALSGNNSYTWQPYFKGIGQYNTTTPVSGAQAYTALQNKQSKIVQSGTITIAVADWDSTDNTATLDLSSAPPSDLGRTVIDIPPSELDDWADFGVQYINGMSQSTYLDGAIISSTITSMTFKCDTIPDKALTFKLTSMEVS